MTQGKKQCKKQEAYNQVIFFLPKYLAQIKQFFRFSTPRSLARIKQCFIELPFIIKWNNLIKRRRIRRKRRKMNLVIILNNPRELEVQELAKKQMWGKNKREKRTLSQKKCHRIFMARIILFTKMPQHFLYITIHFQGKFLTDICYF